GGPQATKSWHRRITSDLDPTLLALGRNTRRISRRVAPAIPRICRAPASRVRSQGRVLCPLHGSDPRADCRISGDRIGRVLPWEVKGMGERYLQMVPNTAASFAERWLFDKADIRPWSHQRLHQKGQRSHGGGQVWKRSTTEYTWDRPSVHPDGLPS